MRLHRVPGMITLALVVAAVIALASCSRSRLTKDNYDRVATGMSPKEVEAILGAGTEQASSSMAVPGVSVAGVSVPGSNTSAKVLTWQEGRKVVSVTFLNDKVMSKTQFGL